jgi:hypothetical protein
VPLKIGAPLTLPGNCPTLLHLPQIHLGTPARSTMPVSGREPTSGSEYGAYKRRARGAPLRCTGNTSDRCGVTLGTVPALLCAAARPFDMRCRAYYTSSGSNCAAA